MPFLMALRLAFAPLTFTLVLEPDTLTFALEEGESGGGSLSGLASQFGYNIGGSGGGAFTGYNLLELMKSRRLI